MMSLGSLQNATFREPRTAHSMADKPWKKARVRSDMAEENWESPSLDEPSQELIL